MPNLGSAIKSYAKQKAGANYQYFDALGKPITKTQYDMLVTLGQTRYGAVAVGTPKNENDNGEILLLIEEGL